MNGNKKIACGVCGGERKSTKTVASFRFGKRLFIFISVPASECVNCGETWLNHVVVTELDHLLSIVKKDRQYFAPFYSNKPIIIDYAKPFEVVMTAFVVPTLEKPTKSVSRKKATHTVETL